MLSCNVFPKTLKYVLTNGGLINLQEKSKIVILKKIDKNSKNLRMTKVIGFILLAYQSMTPIIFRN